MALTVPRIDITPYVSGGGSAERADVAAATDSACREVGFVQVSGHGIPPGVVADLAGAMDAFFDLDAEAKALLARPKEENRGYSAPRSESLSLSAGVEVASRMNDFFEAYNVGTPAAAYGEGAVPRAVAHQYAENTWPEQAGFRAAVETYVEHARRVADTLVRVFEDALGLEPGALSGLASHPVALLRMNNYALPPGTVVELDGDLTGMGEHTDFGIVTVLWADQVAGLQVLGPDRAWHDVVPDPGALLVNLGDLTARLTNERWMSTLHRVKPPVVAGTVARRRSAAFFLDGDAEAVVGPLPGFVDAAHPALYAPVTVDEHVRAKLAGSRAGVLNTAAEREEQRVRSAG